MARAHKLKLPLESTLYHAKWLSSRKSKAINVGKNVGK